MQISKKCKRKIIYSIKTVGHFLSLKQNKEVIFTSVGNTAIVQTHLKLKNLQQLKRFESRLGELL